MKTKTRTQQIRKARQNKQAAQMSTAQKVGEYVKISLFFGVPVVLIVCGILMRNNSFNAF